MNSVDLVSCEDLRNLFMTFVLVTAESVQAIQGNRGIMIMSIDLGSRLWNELEEKFSDYDCQKTSIGEKIECFMESLKRIKIIEDCSLACEDGRLEITIKNCFLVEASNKQRHAGLEYPLCPIGGLIVAGLHRNAGLLTTLEKIEHDPSTGISRLTFDLHPPRTVL
jgi:hypothetical protein